LVTLTMEINIDCQLRRGFVQTIRPSSDNTTACWHHEDDSVLLELDTLCFSFSITAAQHYLIRFYFISLCTLTNPFNFIFLFILSDGEFEMTNPPKGTRNATSSISVQLYFYWFDWGGRKPYLIE
jgi:hypothetical protein